jgi:hypothetical protein
LINTRSLSIVIDKPIPLSIGCPTVEEESQETLMRASASHVVVNSSTFTVMPLPHDTYFQTVEHTGVAWAHRRPTVDLAARFLSYVSGAFGEEWRQV